MSNLLIYPIIIPLLMAMVLVFFRDRIKLQQWLTVLSLLATIGVSLFTVYYVSTEQILVLELGGWSAPFGIVLVGDMLAVVLVAVASFVTLMCLLYGFQSIDTGHKKHFVYPMILVLLTGVNGSFLTGDIFNRSEEHTSELQSRENL